MLRDVGRHVVADGDDALPVAAWRDALFEQIARADIQAAMANVDSLVTAPDDRRYQELRPHWRRVRTLFSRPAAADDLRCDACGRAGRRSAELPARRG